MSFLFETQMDYFTRINGKSFELLCYSWKYVLYFDKFCGIIVDIILCVFIPFYWRAKL